eukprot:jgi/Ulvmu1/865/UM100_0016.1
MGQSKGFDYRFGDVPVVFPYDAYDVQMRYMEAVIKALHGRVNALLESPTGTGKTLCLLCAALAWQISIKQNARKKDQAAVNQIRVKAEGGVMAQVTDNNTQGVKAPRILYCSRTHSQIQQVASEMHKTKYGRETKSTLLGSRGQLCLHPHVKDLTGTAQAAACDAAVKGNGCDYVRDIQGRKSQLEGISDIEDLVQVGKARKVCPFYATKALAEDADIVFMPYNYVTDDILAMHKLLEGAVLILDEAHNMESVCQDTASFDLSSGHVAMCIKELQACIDSLSTALYRGNAPKDTVLGGASPDQAINTWKVTRQLIGRLEGIIKAHSDPSAHPDGCTKPASHALEVFRSLNITEDSCDMLLGALRSTQSYSAADTSLPASMKLQGTSALLRVLCTVFGRRLHVDKGERGGDGLAGAQRTAAGLLQERQRLADALDAFKVHYHMQSVDRSVATMPCMSFWCMSSGVVMQRLQAAGVRNILLTSGTLSPLAATAEELAVPMPVRLENPHVVPPEQVRCTVLCKGPAGVTLNGSYSNRASAAYKRDLGAAVLDVAQATPRGMLVFFPSHAAMQAITAEWRSSGLWRKLEAIKAVMLEPRTVREFQTVIERYRQAVAERESGAMLLAVCQGRVSEGIDFSDDEGRAVVVAGIPFPPAKDARVLCKKQVIDDRKRRGQGTLTGGAWYTLCAMRVVNQALGRVIRHRADFGAIFLADERFARLDMRNNISYWARSLLTVRNSWGNCGPELREFFRVNEARAPKRKPRAGGPAAEQHAAFGQKRLGAGGAPEGPVKKRMAFNPPKRAPGAVAAGGGPSRAGAAENGAGVLSALERTMNVPAAVDVCGVLDHTDPRRYGRPPPRPAAAADSADARAARLAQQRAARAAEGVEAQMCCMAERVGGGGTAGVAGETDSKVKVEAAGKGGAAVGMLADLKQSMPAPRYKKVKAAIQSYVKSRDAREFAQQLASPLRGTGRAAEYGQALELSVTRADRITFRKVLQDALRSPAAPAASSQQPSAAHAPATQQAAVKAERAPLKPHSAAAPQRHANADAAPLRVPSSSSRPAHQTGKAMSNVQSCPANTRGPLQTAQTPAGQRAAFTPLQPAAAGRTGRPAQQAVPGPGAQANKAAGGKDSFFSSAPRRPTASQPPGPNRPSSRAGPPAAAAAASRDRPAPNASSLARGMSQSGMRQPGGATAAVGSRMGRPACRLASAPSIDRGGVSASTAASGSKCAGAHSATPAGVHRANPAGAREHVGTGAAAPVAAAGDGGGAGASACRKCGGAIPPGRGGGSAVCGHLVCGSCWVNARLEAKGQATVCPVCGAAMRARGSNSGGARQ